METTLLTSGDHSCRPLERLKPPQPALNTVPTGAVLVHQTGRCSTAQPWEFVSEDAKWSNDVISGHVDRSVRRDVAD